jgi:DNA-binding MurR/RpiR family transcriptional regulator
MVKAVKPTFHLAASINSTDRSLDDLILALAELVSYGSPAIAGFAKWALHHPEEMALHSVRRLSDLSGANINTVDRLSIALGFSGFED